MHDTFGSSTLEYFPLSILVETVFFSLTTLHHEPNAVQSRVRRLIGRRRAGGLDRYIGAFSRESSQQQDSTDPITELLSQLSGSELCLKIIV